MTFLYAQTMIVKNINNYFKQKMFELYSRYYGGTSSEIFFKDLHQKDQAILLMDDQKQMRGFTTLQLLPIKHARAIFSGDTIVEDCFWGKNNLATAWIELAGNIKQQAPHLPLYWFLIVKGHRTYRYLSTFSKTYYPAPHWETPAVIRQIMDELAFDYFGEAYDPKKGIVRYPESRGHLLDPWAKIPEKDLQRPEVRFFLERNPFYFKGEELVCFCELEKENLKPLAQRYFQGR